MALILILMTVILFYGIAYLWIALLVWVGSLSELYAFTWFLATQTFVITLMVKLLLSYILPSKK